MTSPLDEGWKTNGAGKRYNHKFGFGRLDVSRMVDKALKWKNVDRQRVCHGAAHNTTRFVESFQFYILSQVLDNWPDVVSSAVKRKPHRIKSPTFKNKYGTKANYSGRIYDNKNFMLDKRRE